MVPMMHPRHRPPSIRRGIYFGMEGSGTNMPETGGLIYRKLEKEFPNSEAWLLSVCVLKTKNRLKYCKQDMYWSSSWARILNVQDIIIERTKETSISSTCKPIPSTTIAGAGQPSKHKTFV